MKQSCIRIRRLFYISNIQEKWKLEKNMLKHKKNWNKEYVELFILNDDWRLCIPFFFSHQINKPSKTHFKSLKDRFGHHPSATVK